jgi:hypothetical protein
VGITWTTKAMMIEAKYRVQEVERQLDAFDTLKSLVSSFFIVFLFVSHLFLPQHHLFPSDSTGLSPFHFVNFVSLLEVFSSFRPHGSSGFFSSLINGSVVITPRPSQLRLHKRLDLLSQRLPHLLTSTTRLSISTPLLCQRCKILHLQRS